MTDENLKWQNKVADVRAKGVLGMQLYVILTSPTGPMDAVLAQMGGHLAFQKQLEQDGIMFAAGPFADDEEQVWSGAGMVIIRAESLDQAKNIADQDPMHLSGARDYRIRPWLLNEGSLTVRVTYSDGGRQIS